MLEMAKLTPEDRLVDLGSGDGRLVITAAKRGATARGIEFNPEMVALSRRAAAAEGVAGRATFEQADIFESDFSDATVVTLFLLPDLNIRLRPTLLNMKPGTRVVSNSFTMDKWQPDEVARVKEGCTTYCDAYKWVIPANAAGTWRMADQELVLTQTFQMLEGTLRIGEVLYNPKTGYMAKQGKDVIAGYGDATEALNQVRQKALDGIQSTAVRQMAEPVINARMQNALDTINRHSATETQRYKVQTSDSRAIVSLQDAAFNYADDNRFRQALAVTREETANLAQLQGWDEDTARLQAQKYADAGYRMRYEAWAMKDPVAAFANFQQNAEGISPLVRDNIGRQLFQHAAPVLATALNQNGGAGVAPSAPGDMTAPRGVRNNNPGNVMRGSQAWEGEIQGNDPRYSSFATPEAGIRAMGKTLINYQDKHGINTVEGVISRWAPATENNTAAYVATVAKEMGVKPDAALDLHDTATLNKLTRAVIRVENGKQPYSDDQIALGLAAATGNLRDEITRSFWQFKAFPITQFERLWDIGLSRPSAGGKAQFIGAVLLMQTMAGAMMLQTQSLLSGEDPRPMDDWKFWLAAFIKGGSLGIYGDFLYSQSGTTRYGSGPLEVLAGPTIGSAADAVTALVQAGNAVAAGKDTHLGAKLLNIAKGYIPAQTFGTPGQRPTTSSSRMRRKRSRRATWRTCGPIRCGSSNRTGGGRLANSRQIARPTWRTRWEGERRGYEDRH